MKSNSRPHKRFCYRQISPDTRNKRKRDTALQHDDSVFGPRRSQKTYTRYKTTRSCRLGRRQWKGAAAPSASTTPSAGSDLASDATRLEDLHSEGRHRHHTRAIAARVFSKNPARADGSAGHPEASASCPPKTSSRLEASTAQLRRRSRQWTTQPGSGRPNLLPEPTLPLSVLTPLPPASAHRRAAEGFL
jgi:hypothetical protein